MKEKSIFFMGLGTGFVITSIISLFSYNILKLNTNSVNNINMITTTTVETEIFEESSNVITIEPKTQDTTEVTTKEMKFSSNLNLEITTDKPFELSTN